MSMRTCFTIESRDCRLTAGMGSPSAVRIRVASFRLLLLLFASRRLRSGARLLVFSLVVREHFAGCNHSGLLPIPETGPVSAR